MDSATPECPKITSLSDLQNVIENMERYPIPKLDKANIALLEDALNVFEQKYQGSEIVMSIQFVTSVIDHAIKSYTYEPADWDLIASNITMLFRRILKCMTYNPRFLKSEQSVGVISSATEILLTLGNQTITLRSLLMKHIGNQLLHLICWEDLPIHVRRKMLLRFKKLLAQLPTFQREALVKKTSFPKSSLASMLPSCGDHEFQEYTTELLVRFAMTQHGWKNVLKAWFSDIPSVVDAIDILNHPGYEISCRNFLNLVNGSGTPDSRVHSLPCLYAAISNQIELKKPASYDELWLDCSPRTAEIQLVVEDDVGCLIRVSVEFACVQSIKCSRSKWPRPNGKEECCQLVIKVHPALAIPFETQVTFSELLVLVKKDSKFHELENHFLKRIYAKHYEPERGYALKTQFSSKSSLITSSSSRKTSLANLTFSTIEVANSDTGIGVGKIPRFSSSLVAPDGKLITTSTPLHSLGKDSTSVRKVRRKVLRKSMGTETVGDRKEVEAIDTVSVSSGHRTSVSDQVTHFAHTHVRNADHSQCVSIQAVENDLSIPLMEEFTRHINSQSNEVNGSNLEAMLTHGRITSPQHSGITKISNSQTASGSFGMIGDNVEDVSDATTLTARGGAGHRVDQCSKITNATLGSVPGPLTSQQVFGNNASLMDFKALLPPPPPVKSFSPISPSQQLFKNKFFLTCQKPLVEVSESEESLSSCCTRISKRRSGGCVQICSPSLNFNACAVTKTSVSPEDPYSFIEDEKVEKYERVAASTSMIDNIPAAIAKDRKKRKLYTPGRDDVLQSDHGESPCHSSAQKNNELPIRCNGSTKKKVGNCILDPRSGDKPESKMNIRSNKCEIANDKYIRKSSRPKKKVNYKDVSSSESGVCFAEPRSSDKLSRGSSRRIERLRSEGVVSRPPAPLGSAPIAVDVDTVSSPVNPKMEKNRVNGKRENTCVNNVVKRRRDKKQPDDPNTELPCSLLSDDVVMTEPRQKQRVAPQCNVPTVLCTSEATSDIEAVRQQGSENMRNLGHDYQATESVTMCVDTPDEALPDVEYGQHMRPLPAIQPFRLDSDMLKQNEGKSVSLKAPFTPSHATQVQMGNDDVNRLNRMSGLSDQIRSEVETYVNWIKSDSIMEPVKLNLSTCLANHKDAMNTIKDENSKIARSTAIMQSACEKSMASLEEALEMLGSIEPIHQEPAVRNDPRT